MDTQPSPLGPAELNQKWLARPDLNTSSMHVVSPLKRAQALLAVALEPVYESSELTPSEVDVLVLLRYLEEPVIARRLAQWMGLSRAAVSKMLAKLESRGLIDRRANPADQRSALVTISQDGVAAIDKIFPRHLEREAQVLAGLGSDRERVIEALELLVQALERTVLTS
ncbi:MarR family winged helix-turn-helix transcriptional regulator [Streptomyces sp. NPDC050743]|uniref:MarR family winged helix-turn-helix transcriptional regulator n=1 Tax=Streptomyces sp. NPDC050743 TaxID=3365634 RepID=UPI0037A7270A